MQGLTKFCLFRTNISDLDTYKFAKEVKTFKSDQISIEFSTLHKIEPRRDFIPKNCLLPSKKIVYVKETISHCP